jgi:hypothetical protein
MDITPQENTTTQPISDDQELAKALAGVLPDAPEEPAPAADALQFEETPAPVSVPPVAAVDPAATAAPSVPPIAPIVIPEPVTPAATDTSAATDLDTIKNDALQELRPLIDRVDLPAEEKFDTYLMLIRSTDDSSLIGPAHEAAQNITDEKRKAEALLDIIKEIDYLSRKDQTAA